MIQVSFNFFTLSNILFFSCLCVCVCLQIDLPKWKNPVLIRSDHHYHQWGQLKIKTVIKTLQNSLIIWIFSSMILRLLFSLDILALFLSEKEQTIDYFDQLELFLQIHPDYRIILNPNSTTAKIFLEARIFSIFFMEWCKRQK